MVITYNNKPLPEPFTVYIPGFNFSRYMEYADEDIDCELIDGVLVIHSPASLEHELIFKFILNILDLYTQQNGLGIVVGSRFTMRLSDSLAPEPDIMFIERGMADRLKETYLDGPATVVFEILSPSNHEDDLTKKIPGYIKLGVKE
ncbi:MAG: Uma2 family endonuclease, partial [Candidatus Sigynarchaeum springense]